VRAVLVPTAVLATTPNAPSRASAPATSRDLPADQRRRLASTVTTPIVASSTRPGTNSAVYRWATYPNRNTAPVPATDPSTGRRSAAAAVVAPRRNVVSVPTTASTASTGMNATTLPVRYTSSNVVSPRTRAGRAGSVTNGNTLVSRTPSGRR
jgi:hypothetical protein